MTTPVVITGFGLVTPLGANPDIFWGRLLTGPSAAGPITAFPAIDCATQIACEVSPTVFPAQLMDTPADGAPINRARPLALAAAAQALVHAGLAHPGTGALPASSCEPCVGLVVGTTLGEAIAIERIDPLVDDNGQPRPELRQAAPAASAHLLAGAIAMQLGLHGLVLATTAACAAGNHALAIGYEWIRGGRAPVVLAGGAEGLSRLAHIGFSRLHVVASDLCRPFDRRRQGLLLGEGAAFLVLEDPVHARARGAHIWAGLAGYGLAGDAYHLVAPHPEGRGAALAMRRALHMAGIAPEDIDYINAHGTGTPQNDSAETSAIKSAFGRHAFQVPISSIKALGGHAMGAAAAIEAIACVLALQHQCIPPTHHLEEPDPLCDLDYVPQVPREARLRWVMNNSFAFGGNNAAVVLAHPDAV